MRSSSLVHYLHLLDYYEVLKIVKNCLISHYPLGPSNRNALTCAIIQFSRFRLDYNTTLGGSIELTVTVSYSK